MARVEAKVELLAHTPEPLALIYAAFRQCYHAGFVGDLWPELTADGADRARQAAFVRSVLESGHGSPVEHVSFTFALSGVSRALTHQLVRHRIASYSQQSQRYVDASNFDYVLPRPWPPIPGPANVSNASWTRWARPTGTSKPCWKRTGGAPRPKRTPASCCPRRRPPTLW